MCKLVRYAAGLASAVLFPSSAPFSFLVGGFPMGSPQHGETRIGPRHFCEKVARVAGHLCIQESLCGCLLEQHKRVLAYVWKVPGKVPQAL